MRYCKKMNIRAAGGTAGKNSKRYTVDIPPLAAREIDITEDHRDIEIYTEEDKIIIKRAKAE